MNGNYCGNGADSIAESKEIDGRCIVDFRPIGNDEEQPDNWKGEYGFDWFRDCDTFEKVNFAQEMLDYNTIVGKYNVTDPDYDPDTSDPFVQRLTTDSGQVNDYIDRLKNQYPSISIINDDYRSIYFIPSIRLFFMSIKPWMTENEKVLPNKMIPKRKSTTPHSYCTTETEIKLSIKAKSIKSIELKFDDCIYVQCGKSAPQEKLSQKSLIISPIPDGESERIITIALRHDFKEEQKSIYVWANHQDGFTRTFAGQLNVLRCNPKTIDICFVNVKFKHNGVVTSGLTKNKIEEQKALLGRYLSQANIIPTFENPKDLDVDLKNYWTTYYEDDVLLKEENNNKLGAEIETLFKKKFPNLADKYKIFFLGARGIDRYWVKTGNTKRLVTEEIAGFATGIGSNSIAFRTCVLFQGAKGSNSAHELFHCLGLVHSFANCGKHTFIKKTTNNIMDYSNNSYTLWHWQWDIIRNAIGVTDIEIK